MQDNKPIEVSIDSRIMIDAIFFRKINPNHSRPRVIETRNPKLSFFDMWEEESGPDVDAITRIGRRPRSLREKSYLFGV